MPLARDIGLASFSLRIERIELLLEALFRGFAGVDSAAQFCPDGSIVLTGVSHLRCPHRA